MADAFLQIFNDRCPLAKFLNVKGPQLEGWGTTLTTNMKKSTLPKPNILAAENAWLEIRSFPFGARNIFRTKLLVSGREGCHWSPVPPQQRISMGSSPCIGEPAAKHMGSFLGFGRDQRWEVSNKKKYLNLQLYLLRLFCHCCTLDCEMCVESVRINFHVQTKLQSPTTTWY